MRKELQAPPRREMPGDRLLLTKERLIQDIALMEQRSGEDLKRSPRRRRVVAALLVPAALIMIGGAYAITRPPASATVEGIVCYQDASGSSGGAVVAVDGRQPAEVCAELWEAGSILPNVSTAPPLQSCTLARAHYVGVFPSDDPSLCASLGLAPIPAGYEEAAARFAAMRDDLYQRLSSDGTCVSGNEATLIARQTLNHHGFDEWTIESVGPWTQRTPCTDYSLDAVRQVLRLYAETRSEA